VSAQSFEETGLAAPLAQAVAALHIDEPNTLQRQTIPVIRRGGNVVVRASTGAGATLAWSVGVLERVPALPEGAGPRVLIITPTEERAVELAESLAALTAAVSDDAGAAWRALRVRALAVGWITRDADVLVASMLLAAAEVEASTLKLDGIGALVMDGVAQMLALNGAAALETVLVSTPRDAQRVFVSAEISRDVDKLVEPHARRAVHIPPRPADGDVPAETGRKIPYIVAQEAGRLDVLMHFLSTRDAAEEVIVTRSYARAGWLRDALARRGLGAAALAPDVRTYADGGLATIAWDVPFDGAGLNMLSGTAPLVFIAPAERAHLQAIARAAGITPEPAARPARSRDSLTAYRRRIWKAIEEEDIDAQFALLGPLFERHAPEEVAAALSALLRRRAPAPEVAKQGQAPAPAFVRLFISAGQRDGLRPADLVGAIAGEAGLTGDRIGRIEIRESFTVAEVEAAAADKVIRALNGTTLRGRSVRVDYDRRSTPGAVRRSRPPRPGP
jgi:ATP-dependent RNA helicase DeaD